MKNIDLKAPIPQLKKGITINRGDKNKVLYTVSPYYSQKDGYSKPTRVVIGKAIDSKQLIPNKNYRIYFPDLWKQVSNENIPAVSKRAGMYAVMNALCDKNNLRNILEKVFGIEKANAVLDYAMYSIISHSNSALNFSSCMEDHVLFSEKFHDDAYYSALFAHEISDTEINLFKRYWVQECVRQGCTSVYLAIDGSNDDCNSNGVELAEKGAAKSKRNTDIVSFMYAVDPSNGKVITFDTYRGSMVDSKAILMMITFLRENHIQIRGVIIDRGFCDGKYLDFLHQNNLPFILMMKESTAGYKYMMAEHSDELRWNTEHWIPGTLLFAVSETWKLFGSSSLTAHLHLYYDFRNGDERCETLLNKISKAIKGLSEGKSIPSDLSHILRKNDEGGYTICSEKFRQELSSKGFFVIASSENKPSSEIYQIYSSRDASEKEFMFVKRQLGYGAVRVQSDESTRSRFMTGVIAAIIRSEIEQVCKEEGVITNTAINEIDRICISCFNGESYTMVHTEKAKTRQLLNHLGVKEDCLDEAAKRETRLFHHELPTIRKKKPGPKKGSHHKKRPVQPSAQA